MRAAEQWALLEQDLGADWAEAHLSFVPEGPTTEAAAILAPLGPGHVTGELRFHVMRRDGGSQRLRNLLERLDRKRVWGTLALVGATRTEPADMPTTTPPQGLARAWDELVQRLAPGWSDLLCELELASSDHLPRAALLGAPLNPTRNPAANALRFRVSGKQGYGASSGMARRCFERMDAESIAGQITVLGELSDTENAVTQGPVWRFAGRSV